MSDLSPPLPHLPLAEPQSYGNTSAGAVAPAGFVPAKTDSEEEGETLVIRPKVLGAQNAKRRLLAFSVTKLGDSPLKQIKNKLKEKKEKKKLPLTKVPPIKDPIGATVAAIEEEKKHDISLILQAVEAQNLILEKQQQKKLASRRQRSRSRERRRSPNRRRGRSRSRSRSASRRRKSRSVSKERDKDSHKEKKAKQSKTPEPEEPEQEIPSDWEGLKKAGIAIDENFRRLKLRAERKRDLSICKTSRPEDVVLQRLEEVKPILDYCKIESKPRASLLALPIEGTRDAGLISYPQKIVHFTSTTPILTWAPHPRLEDEAYYMSRVFYLAHADGENVTVFRTIADVKQPTFKESQLIEKVRNWYPEKEYLKESLQKEDTYVKKPRSNMSGRDRKISLVDYESGDEKSGAANKGDDLDTKASVRIVGGSVKVKSKWDSDEDSSSQDECSMPSKNEKKPSPVTSVSSSGAREATDFISSRDERSKRSSESDESPQEKLSCCDKKAKPVEVRVEPNEKKEAAGKLEKNDMKTVEPTKLKSRNKELCKVVLKSSESIARKDQVRSSPSRGKPQLVSEYEEFLKLVGTESPKSKSQDEKPTPVFCAKNDWDQDSSSADDRLNKSTSSQSFDKRSLSSERIPKMSGKEKKEKKLKKKRESLSSSDSETSSSSSSAKSVKKKKRKKKKRTKKAKLMSKSSSSSSDSDDKKKKLREGKKSKRKFKEKDIAEKLLLDLQLQKQEIARKLSELDSLADKKSKKEIAKELKNLEKKISKTHKVEGLVLPKKGKKLKKLGKRKKSSSSSESSDTSDEVRKKKDKKKLKKKKSKRRRSSSSSESSDDEDYHIKAKKRKKEKKRKDEKELKRKGKPIDEEYEKEVKMWRKPADDSDIALLPRTRTDTADDEGSGWEDEDEPTKVIGAKPVPGLVKDAITVDVPNSANDDNKGIGLIDKGTAPKEPTSQALDSQDWEVPSETEQNSLSSEWEPMSLPKSAIIKEMPDNPPAVEFRAFQSVTSDSLRTIHGPTRSDLYSPGASDSSESERATPLQPLPIGFTSDSSFGTLISNIMPDNLPSQIRQGSTYATQMEVVGKGTLFSYNSPSFSNEPFQQDQSLGSGAGIDDIYDPLTVDSDMSVEEEDKSSALEEIPLPAVPAVADILLPGEVRDVALISKPNEKPSVFPLKPEVVISPVKVNRWDRPPIPGQPLKTLVPLGVVMPQPVTIEVPLPPVPATGPALPPRPNSSFFNEVMSSTPLPVDQKSGPILTVKMQPKLQSRVASVFQEDSDDEDSAKEVKTDFKTKLVEVSQKKELQSDIVQNIENKGQTLTKIDLPQDETDLPNLKERNTEELKRFDEKEKKPDKDRHDRKDERKDKRDDRERDRRDERTRKDEKKREERTRDRRKSRSPSPRRRRTSRSPDKKPPRSPDRRRYSRSPDKRDTKRHSRSPDKRDAKRRSRSQDRRDGRRYSRSPDQRRRHSRSPPEWRRKRSLSPRRKPRSPSPRRRRRAESPRRRRSRSRSKSNSPRSKRPKRRSRSRTPVRRGESPRRRRTPSPSHTSSNEPPSKIPVIVAHGAPPPPLPSAPYPLQDQQERLTLDQRIELELGVKLRDTPPPPVPSEATKGYFYPGQPTVYHAVPSYPPAPGPVVQVRQVGNIMEVVPGLNPLAPPPPPPPPPQQRIVQVGNVLQVVPSARATAVVAPTQVAAEPTRSLELEALQNPLIKAIQAEREKRRKEKETRRLEREARRRARQAKRDAELMSVSEKLKKSERNEGLVLGQDLEDEELLLEALEPPSPPGPLEVIIEGGDLPPAGKSILVTPGFNKRANEGERKAVKFADGILPGEASASGEDRLSPPPKIKLPKEKRFKKKVKKKVKVQIIRQVIESEQEDDDLPPPSPPPGDPPPILYATFPFGGQVQYPVYQTTMATTTTKTTVHVPAPLPANVEV